MARPLRLTASAGGGRVISFSWLGALLVIPDTFVSCFMMDPSAGNAVMKGYLKNDRATAEAFDQARSIALSSS